jgi:hypothetical protein
MKNILFAVVLFSFTVAFTAENGKLTGVVTYKDAYELSNQADAGSEIYAISEADARAAQYGDVAKVIGRFMMDKSNYLQSVFNTIDPKKVNQAQDYFDTVSYFTSKYISGFKKLPAIVKGSVNGKGIYTLSLKPGKNYVLFISGNVNSNNVAESKGNIDLKVVDVKSAGETLQDANFKKHENLMIMLLTGRFLQGC